MQNFCLSLAIFTSILLGESSNSRGIVDDFTKLKYKIAKATRVSKPPVIDGIIDDLSWSDAFIIDEFLQFEPYNLEAPSVHTEARVLYDDEYLYIAFNNVDPNPENIMKRLARRDDWESGFGSNSDWVGIGIDSRNDDKTGYWFAVNAAEVQVDVVIAGEGHDAFDSTWNVVWESKVSHNANGWSAEIRIPFNVFQFSKNDIQEWGASFQRHYYGQQEEIQWPGRAKGVRGMVPHYGILKGIKDIPPPRNFELMPYLLAGQVDQDKIDNTQNIGLDAKYSLTSNTTINMTFNPDFGQVQADPSVLNLSAFETRLHERRPFFVQGANFFKSRLNLFNSRRIGNRPDYYSPDSGTITDQPNETRILGAAKILGETSTGVRYGIINAVTNKEYGTREYEDGEKLNKESFLLEPYTNYFVGRIEKPIINNLSTIGVMSTDLRRQGEKEQNSAFNIDWRIKLIDNKLSFDGQTANSINNGLNGYASRFILSYRDPVWWDLSSWAGYRDKNFDVSSMGYQEKNNNWYVGLRGSIRRDQPKGVFLNQSLRIKYNIGGLNDGLITRKNIELEQDNNFLNYWGIGWEIKYNPEVYEDDDIYRDSRALIIKDEAWQSFNFWFRTDRRKRVIIRPRFDINKGEIRGVGTSYRLELMIRPTDYIHFEISAERENKPGSMQWVGILEDENGTNIIYSNTQRKQSNVEARLNINFSPKMTFEAYYQPFKVEMNYVDYNRLLEEKSFNVSPYQYNEDKDFRINNQVGTFVFRWEYLPGSLIYAVYNLHDNNYYSYEKSSWSRSKSNSLFLKVDYFFQI